MRRSFGAGVRWAAHVSQARSPGCCQSITSKCRPQKQHIFPASRIRVVEDRSPLMVFYDKRTKSEIHPQIQPLENKQLDSRPTSESQLHGKKL